MEGIYFWWLELNRQRTNNGYSHNPLSFQEIYSWSKLTGIVPSPYEVSMMLMIDSLYLKVKSKEKKE